MLLNHWQPTAPLAHLEKRAEIIKQIRRFFETRNFLEVTTPVLDHASIPDPAIDSLKLEKQKQSEQAMYLQTSPEFFMKRLLARDKKNIFQIAPAFRAEEKGKKHRNEFTLLEWYHIGFDHHELINEVDELLTLILNTKESDRRSYAECFEENLNINPHTASIDDLQNCAKENNISVSNAENLAKDECLDLLLSHLIEPKLGLEKPTFIYDYPQSQAALAACRKENNIIVGERFEVYYKGIELANGFHELACPELQLERFKNENEERKKLKKETVPIPMELIEALNHGLPECAGVALGIERLIMLALNCHDIKDVMSFG